MLLENSTPNNTESAVKTLIQRPRRLRGNSVLRSMVHETQLTVDDLIYPMFVMEGENQTIEISSMRGCYRYTLDLLLEEIQQVRELGMNAICLQQRFAIALAYYRRLRGCRFSSPIIAVPLL